MIYEIFFLKINRFLFYHLSGINTDMISSTLRFFDIAANLASEHFQGIYNNKQLHPEDVNEVIQRAEQMGCKDFLFVGGDLKDSKRSFELSQRAPNFFCTIGVHPCRVMEIEAFGSLEKYIEEIERLIELFGPKCVMIGECGLDYDLTHYAAKEYQIKCFPFHFDLAEKYNKPMYLHNRNTGDDFYQFVRENRHKFNKGVVHTFDGDLDELKKALALDLYIGISGCSLRDPASFDVVKEIPLDKILLETDAPYCEIKTTHPGYKMVKTKYPNKKPEKHDKGFLVKGRNEPCNIIQVAEVVSEIRNISIEELTEAAYKNTFQLLGINENDIETGNK